MRGAHDLSMAPALREQIEAALTHDSNIVVDFSAATFIDSSVLGAVLGGWNTAAAQSGRALVVCAPRGSAARSLLEYVGLAGDVRVFDDLDAAMTYLSESTGEP